MNPKDISSLEKIWLVKSSLKILGPYSLVEITELLQDHQISILDEVRQPNGRWEYIRESKAFIDTVKKIREQQENGFEQTVAVAHPNVSGISLVPFENKPENHIDDKTPLPEVVDQENDKNIKDVASTSEKVFSSSSSALGVSGQSKSYGLVSDSRFRRRIERQSHVLRWLITGIVTALVIAIVVIINFKAKQKEISQEDLFTQAIHYKNFRLYQKSLEIYKKLTSTKVLSLDRQFEFAPLLISEGGETLTGRRVLENSLLADGKSSLEKLNIDLSIAVSHIIEGNLKDAERILTKILESEPENESALFNSAVIFSRQGQDLEAQKIFNAIYNKNPNSMLALYGYSVSTIERQKISLNHEIVKSLIGELKKNIINSTEMRQQLSFLLVYLSQVLGDESAVEEAVTHFLSLGVGYAEQFVHPLYIDWRFTQWEYLDKYCLEFFEKSHQTARIKALRAVCLIETHRDTEAQVLIKEALSESPKDYFVLGVEVGLLQKTGRLSEAAALLRMPELESLAIKDQLHGTICLKLNDLECANQAFSHRLKIDNQDIFAIQGLAQVKTLKMKRAEALQLIQTGMKINSKFLPFLELLENLETQK